MSRTLRHKLDLTPDPEVNVIGISCHENDYRLCWSLNRGLGLALTRRATDIVDEEAGEQAAFPAFDHEDTERQVRYTLVCNRGAAGALVREQRLADYFLVVDEQAPESPDELLERVRRSEFVLAAFPVDIGQLRSGHKLLQ